MITTSHAKINDESLQVIVVKTKAWDSIPAIISLYERKNSNSKWEKYGEDIEAVIGKKGMGWGKGLALPKDLAGQTFRKEGDKRTPAGIFSFGQVFGIETKDNLKEKLALKMPYLYLSDSIQCVGDSKSKYYNQFVDTNLITKDWLDDSNNELMRFEGLRDEQAYKWGVFINHNTASNPLITKDNTSGSCIFIHLWKNNHTGTSGCTATSEDGVLKILNFLDEKKNPVIVQLPEVEYSKLQESWNLP